MAFLLPSLLAGLLTILLVWDLGRRLWDPATDFWRALLLFTVQFTLQAKTAQIDAWRRPSSPSVSMVSALPALRWRVALVLARLVCRGLGVITKGWGVLALLVLLPALWTHRAQIRARLCQPG